MELTDILRCPQTNNKLRFADGDSVVRVENSDVTYPVIDGIIDFFGGARDNISASYDRVAHRYDRYMTSSSVFMKLCNSIVWGLGDDCVYTDTVLSYLPSQFEGILLDVPAGTGLFTHSLYAGWPDATIIAVDSSMGMLQKARDRFQQDGLNNVCLIRADVANLPIRSAAADIVLSMNGLHVFADKQRAIVEMSRVLRKNGTLIACGYVKGARRLTDWFVRHFGARKRFFNPPFFDVHDIASRLGGLTMTRQGSIKSLFYFEAVNET